MSLSLDLSAFANKSEKKMSYIAREVFINTASSMIFMSPVDTQRFRSNWMPEINKFSTETTDAIESQEQTIAKVKEVAGTFKLGQSMTISNNLKYAWALEYGHSGQAPSGMLRVSFARAQRWISLETKKAQTFTWRA